MPFPPSARRQRGAALLLLVLALSLAAAALLLDRLGGGGGDAAREQLTMRDLAEAREALLGFAARHGRLPRPGAADGREGAPCAPAQPCAGYLPWLALGLPDSDRWGKLLRYSVAPMLTSAPVNAALAVADRRVLTRDAGGAVRDLVGQATCSVDTPCAAALLLSSGRRNLGTSRLGVAQPNGSGANSDELHNNGAVSAYFSRAAQNSPGAAGGEFDDLVLALPLPTLYQRMNAAGRLQ